MDKLKKCKKVHKIILLTLLIWFFSVYSAVTSKEIAKAQDIWQLKKGEMLVEGLYLGYKNNLIQMKVNHTLISYPFSSQTTVALMGIHSGRLVSLPQYPSETPSQVFLDKTGAIRAMRNQLNSYPFVPGTPMDNGGHQATLSPNEKYYTTFTLWEGLYLYDLEKRETPLFLSNQPLCSWNKTGTKIAYVDDNFLGIFDTEKKQHKYYSFPHTNPDTVRVVTSIDWHPQYELLLYTFLEDYPELGSDFCQIGILDKNGNEITTKVWENLGPCCWLSEEMILVVTNPSAQKTGKIFFWNYKTDKTEVLLNELAGNCNNLCYNSHENSLAFTIASNWKEGLAEDLYVFSCLEKEPQKIKSFIYPIRYLQWTTDNTLVFWEEVDNTIHQLTENGQQLLKATGFLPEKGAAQRFIYFLEEPFEEPLPLFLSH